MTTTLEQGESPAADFIRKELSENHRHLHKSAALGVEDLIRGELAEVWEECRLPDWDGYGAFPVTQDAYDNAKRLLLALPLGQRRPSVGAEPDGCLTLEWHHSRRRTLSVSIGPGDELHYAALLGPEYDCGMVTFDGEFPKRLLDLIGQIFPC